MTQPNYMDKRNRLIAAPNPRWMRSPKWIRVFLGGQTVAESRQAHLLRDGGPPVYYFPAADIRMDLLSPSDYILNAPTRGEASYWNVTSREHTAENGAWTYSEPVAGSEFLKGFVAFDWNKMDAWFEEREEVFVHARDPFKRIDTLKCASQVQVVVSGETVADTKESVLLLEPGHPFRYYLPKADVHMELLRPSETISRCPYKGEARYYSIEAGGKVATDVAWSYTYPTPESAKITAMVCFFNERVDEIYVDGEALPKPVKGWS